MNTRTESQLRILRHIVADGYLADAHGFGEASIIITDLDGKTFSLHATAIGHFLHGFRTRARLQPIEASPRTPVEKVTKSSHCPGFAPIKGFGGQRLCEHCRLPFEDHQVVAQ